MAKRQAIAHKPTKLPEHRPGPEGGVRDRNRHDNLRRLCDAGLALFLADGTAGVSIDDIVGEAEMAKGSFYRYISDKAELVAQIINPVAAEVIHALDRCEQALRTARRDEIAAVYLRLALELSGIVATYPSHILLYLQEARAPRGGARASIHALADQMIARTVALTEVARDHKLIRDVDPRVAALIVVGAIDSILFAHLRGRDTAGIDVRAITTELVEIVLVGIRPRR
jgi:AcrR family transcriptional regulator